MKINKLLLPLFAAMTLVLFLGCDSPTTPDKDNGGGGGDNNPPKTDTSKLIEENFIGKWADIFGGSNSFDLKADGKCTQGTYTDEMTWTIDAVKKTITIQNLKYTDVTYVYKITAYNSRVVLKDSTDTLRSNDAKATVAPLTPPAGDGGGTPPGDDDTPPVPKMYPPKYNAPTAKCNAYYASNGKDIVKAIDISWADSSPAGNKVVATAYTLYKATTATATGSPIYNAGKSELKYQDKNVTVGKTYYYYIVARSKDGDGPAGTRVSVKCQ